MKLRALAFALALTGAADAFANDSTAELGTGGLILSRSEEIAMESEDLFISTERVTVDYVFRNQSESDIETIVAFPMPDIEANPYGMVSIPDLASDNFLDFEVTVDGDPVKPSLEQKAFAAGIDITGDLVANNVPLFPFDEAAAEAVAALPAAVLEDWRTRGIVMLEEYDDGGGMKKVHSPYWQLRSTYWWRMTFPAGRPVKVSHAYKPSVGGTAGVTFYYDGRAQGSTLADYKHKYCMDDAFLKAVAKVAKASPDTVPPFTENRLSYILQTGGNWALGTIGRFTLVIDKGNMANLVSFCGEGVEKVGPTTFRMRADDYYPERNLEVLILQRYDTGESYDPGSGN